jgi:hypothetical protein
MRASPLPIVPATPLGIDKRLVRLARALKFNRRGASADIRMVPPRQRAKGAPDGFVVSIVRDSEHNVVVHRASSCEPLLVLITISTAPIDPQVPSPSRSLNNSRTLRNRPISTPKNVAQKSGGGESTLICLLSHIGGM